jgi:hypothetical protein
MIRNAGIHVEPPGSRGIRGYLFVATPVEVAAMDLVTGPTRPMLPGKRGKRPIPLTICAIPDAYDPSLLDAVSAATLPDSEASGLQVIRREGLVALYRFHSAVTDVLSEFVPDRLDFTTEGIALIANRMERFSGVRGHYQKSGLETAVLIVRGYALKARSKGNDTEVFYWCRYRE